MGERAVGLLARRPCGGPELVLRRLNVPQGRRLFGATPNSYGGRHRRFRSCADSRRPSARFGSGGAFLGDAARPAGFDDADGEAAEAGDIFRAVAHADAAAVLVKVPIENVVATVFDDPVPAVNLEHASGAGLLGSAASEAVGDFQRIFTRLFLGGLRIIKKKIANVRKVEIA